jgi:hypothetical protein
MKSMAHLVGGNGKPDSNMSARVYGFRNKADIERMLVRFLILETGSHTWPPSVILVKGSLQVCKEEEKQLFKNLYSTPALCLKKTKRHSTSVCIEHEVASRVVRSRHRFGESGGLMALVGLPGSSSLESRTWSRCRQVLAAQRGAHEALEDSFGS